MDASVLHVLHTREEIAARVQGLAQRVSRDYQGRKPILIGVLKGAFVFLADLVRQLTIPVEVDFVRLSSYGDATESTGAPLLLLDVAMPVAGRDLLVVEDIVDSGRTLSCLLEELNRRGARSVKLCALVDKRQRRQVQVDLDYAGFVVDRGFLVGYGLDCAEAFRHLPDLCLVETGAQVSC
jgi:hypoxanthine phosphoribosyltransferase